MIETKDLKTNLNMGKEIFEKIPDKLKPGWVGLVLSSFNNYVKDVPVSVSELFQIIDDENKWPQAHHQFSEIRGFLLDHKNYQSETPFL